jgi:hypothetical protein
MSDEPGRLNEGGPVREGMKRASQEGQARCPNCGDPTYGGICERCGPTGHTVDSKGMNMGGGIGGGTYEVGGVP